jgi:hypothetical protein
MSTASWATSTERGEDGTGIIGTVVGVLIFLSLLLFAVQVLVGLYATTVVSAAAYDAAKAVAGADGGLEAREVAVEDARRRLGRVGERASFAWGESPDAVVLTVRAPRPQFLPASLGLPDVVRTARVRIEAVR